MPLRLKNGFVLKKKKKKKKVPKQRILVEDIKEETQINEYIEPEFGSGRLISSGTAISGIEGTKFTHELSHGDILIVNHPNTLVDEVKTISMVISDVSLAIDTSFSSDLSTSVTFKYIKKPKVVIDEKTLEKKRKQASLYEEKQAFGTYATTERNKDKIVTYRVRKSGTNASGGYKIVTKKFKKNEDFSREKLLNLRCKQKGDRNCM